MFSFIVFWRAWQVSFFRQLRWKASKPPGAWRTCFNTQFQSCWTARQLDLSWGRYLHGILGMGVYIYIRIKMYTLGEYIICNICTIRMFIYTFNELSNRYMYISYNERSATNRLSNICPTCVIHHALDMIRNTSLVKDISDTCKH